MASPADPFADLPSRVRAAYDASHLGALPEGTTRDLLAAASLVTVPAGSVLHREGDEPAHLQLVVSGLLRVYVTALDGRTLTVRYCRAGSLLGAISLFVPSFAMPATVQAVTGSEALSLSVARVRGLLEHDLALSRALNEELASRATAFVAEIPGSAFATVRQRVARHLLDLASAAPDRPLTVGTSQQDLADAVGSVREVVVRTLRELREAGLVRTGSAGITLLDPETLAAEAYPGPGGTRLTHGWNPGPRHQRPG